VHQTNENTLKKNSMTQYLKIPVFEMRKMDVEQKLLSPPANKADKPTSTPNIDTPTRMIKKELKKNVKQTCCLVSTLILMSIIITGVLIYFLCKYVRAPPGGATL
jgi:hypothetical protein